MLNRQHNNELLNTTKNSQPLEHEHSENLIDKLNYMKCIKIKNFKT